MRVRITVRTCDVPGDRKALFEGQEYDLPADAARELIAAGKAVSTKAVHGPPEDKALEPAEDKGPPTEPPPTEPDSLVGRVLRRKRRTRKAK